MNSTGIDQGGLPQLFDSSQALEGRGIYQIKDQSTRDFDKSMNRIIDDLWGLTRLCQCYQICPKLRIRAEFQEDYRYSPEKNTSKSLIKVDNFEQSLIAVMIKRKGIGNRSDLCQFLD